MLGGSGFQNNQQQIKEETPSNNQTPNVSFIINKKKQKKQEKKQQVILPITIKQFRNKNNDEDLQTAQFSICGRIVKYHEEGINITLSITDDTGILEVIISKKNGGQLPHYMSDFVYSKCIYAKLILYTKVYKDQEMIYCLHFKEIKDHNDVIRHQYEVILRQLQNSAKPKISKPVQVKQEYNGTKQETYSKNAPLSDQLIIYMKQIVRTKEDEVVGYQELDNHFIPKGFNSNQINTSLQELKDSYQIYDCGDGLKVVM